MNSGSKTIWKDIGRWLPGVVISLIALGIVIRLVNWQELLTAFASIRPLNLAVGILITVAWLLIRAAAWRILLNRQPRTGQTFRVINIGYLLNNLFPLRAGEIGRALILGKSSGLGMMHVLSTIVIERAFDLAFAAVFLLSTLPLVIGMDWVKTVAMITLALVFAGLVGLFLVARFSAAR